MIVRTWTWQYDFTEYDVHVTEVQRAIVQQLLG
jgi:hypothetical protein